MAAHWIYENSPVRHIDIGSRIDGFVGHFSVFREVEVIDIRPLNPVACNIRFHQLDLMRDIPPEWIESTDTLSCLHTIEHFGLGRYGDTLDPEGHLKGLAQLRKFVKPGGRLLLSTPSGAQRIEFNAHRVFAPQTVLSWFAHGWEIERSAVLDDGNLVSESSGPEVLATVRCNLGVGIVMAKKTSST